MGRSVMTLGGDSIVAYQEFSPTHFCEECDEFCEEHQDDLFCDAGCDHSDDYQECVLDWVQERAGELWPSFTPTDRWVGRELHVVAENAHSIITVSEYGSLVAVSLGANYDREGYTADDSAIVGLGAAWRNKISHKFLATFGEYEKMGTASNGESFYRKA